MSCNPWRWLWGLIPIAMLSWVAFYLERPKIENDLTRRGQQALDGAGLGWGAVALSGRDLVLTGKAADENEPRKALDIARRVWGVRIVDLRTDLLAKVATFSWSAAVKDKVVRLSGYVPSDEARRAVASSAQAAFPGYKIDDQTSLARGSPARTTWQSGVNFALRQLALLKRGSVELSNTDLTVAGEANDLSAYKSVRAALSKGMPSGITLAANRVSAPIVDPYLWGARITGSQLVLTGYVPSDGVRDEVYAHAKKTFPKVAIVDRLEVADGAPAGLGRAAIVTLDQIAQLKAGVGELKGQQLTLSGEAADEATADRIRRNVRLGVPDPIRTNVNVTVDRQALAAEEAKRKGEADRLAAAAEAQRKAEAGRRAAEAEAKRKAEADRLAANEARRKAEAARVAAEAEAKRKAEAGRQVAAGRSSDTDSKAARQVEADKCSKLMGEAAAAGVILFERAKADLNARSIPTLANVARIARQCPAFRIEVEGHTDSEGIPERNQPLSERRAQAVVDFLVKDGGDATRLKAIGYGAERPIAPNDTPQNMAKNRRIEFKAIAD